MLAPGQEGQKNRVHRIGPQIRQYTVQQRDLADIWHLYSVVDEFDGLDVSKKYCQQISHGGFYHSAWATISAQNHFLVNSTVAESDHVGTRCDQNADKRGSRTLGKTAYRNDFTEFTVLPKRGFPRRGGGPPVQVHVDRTRFWASLKVPCFPNRCLVC